jgi:hypothetical protein
MLCSENDLKNKTKPQRELHNINEEESKIVEAKNLKKSKLEINKFEVIEDNKKDENDEDEVKPIVRGKSEYVYCKESDEGMFIDSK